MANPWYPFFPGDYARDTSHLTLSEHGAYRLLLDHYYSTGRPIPADPERAFCICRAFTSELQSSVRSVLKQFFTETPDGWRNQRADRQIEKQQRVSAKYAARARNAAAARWEHDASSMPQSMLQASEPEPEPEPENLLPSKEDFDFVLNAHAREEREAPGRLHVLARKTYSPAIGDAIDLRKLRDARKELQLKLNHGWGSDLTDDQIFEHQCALAGISVGRGLEVTTGAMKWPARSIGVPA
jgi:uncharacterized protein YdaU (DUF1376 family)